ncbi:MAG TPA: hypothetical protein DEP64_00345 [Ruminococcaceae bacterium]|jgi:L-ribulokinase|nr:hypothetical protein [Oscillospiraceae bacterium]
MGRAAGGYDSIFNAARAMGRIKDKVYRPIPENAATAATCDKLFQKYRTLHDSFGRGGNDVMKRLKVLKKSILKRG